MRAKSMCWWDRGRFDDDAMTRVDSGFIYLMPRRLECANSQFLSVYQLLLGFYVICDIQMIANGSIRNDD